MKLFPKKPWSFLSVVIAIVGLWNLWLCSDMAAEGYVHPKTDVWKVLLGPIIYLVEEQEYIWGFVIALLCIGVASIPLYRDTVPARLAAVGAIVFWFFCAFAYIWQGF